MLPPDRVPLPGCKDVSSAARERIPLLTRPIERTDRLEEKRPWFARPGIAVHGSVGRSLHIGKLENSASAVRITYGRTKWLAAAESYRETSLLSGAEPRRSSCHLWHSASRPRRFMKVAFSGITLPSSHSVNHRYGTHTGSRAHPPGIWPNHGRHSALGTRRVTAGYAPFRSTRLRKRRLSSPTLARRDFDLLVSSPDEAAIVSLEKTDLLHSKSERIYLLEFCGQLP